MRSIVLLALALALAPLVAAQEEFVASPLEPLAETERAVDRSATSEYELVLDPENTLLGIALSRASGVPLGLLDVGNVSATEDATEAAVQDVRVPLANTFQALALGARAPPASIGGLLTHAEAVTTAVVAELPVDLEPRTVMLALALYGSGFSFHPRAAYLTDDRVAGAGEVVDIPLPTGRAGRDATLPLVNAFSGAALGMTVPAPVPLEDIGDAERSNTDLVSAFYDPTLDEATVLGGIAFKNLGLPVSEGDLFSAVYENGETTARDKAISVDPLDAFSALVLGARATV